MSYQLLMNEHKYYVGLDLGQAQDPSAIGILQKVPQCKPTLNKTNGTIEYKVPHHFHGIHLYRFPLGTKYPDIVDKVGEALNSPSLRGRAVLCIDATGVGRPVVDMFSQAKINHVPILITGGHKARCDNGMWHVPKRLLVSTLQAMAQSKRLQIAESHPLAPILTQELLGFQLTITEAANDTYGGRDGVHDDLVLAVAIAAWWGERDKVRLPLRTGYSVSSFAL